METLLRRIRRWLDAAGIFRLLYRRGRVRRYWTAPWEEDNLPERYLQGEERSRFLVSLMNGIAVPSSSILELGCNVGRNLNALFSAGYRQLSGVEINPRAVRLLQQAYPEMAAHSRIHVGSIEDVIKSVRDGSFDVVFTMAVLEHVPNESDWVFREMARVSKRHVVTIEDEKGVSWRHFPRNYKRIFEDLALHEIQEVNCAKVEGLGPDFRARVFEKTPKEDEGPKPT